ncbi:MULTISPECIES: hypothetical protein [unclassified Shinella]|uniref:hypothetical protein n=1 Tax=unclassified Shinella TaxID=2643062 RepID=UPI00225C9ED5|nr:MULTISPECIES: hypothetical protein [unclassified Shinella]MCO5135994.1 hypothetical protein [Shinella sp.]MDC7254371.1 hypothetical protein [Shinella sp. YE25]CAI0337061.1 conserved hypothetical protein [Rhizobiaceae bacterium]CAK7255581.1 conserved protein of unknown function [Shinella sp. WSC3-e]
MQARENVFGSSTERTAWSIAARHLAAGQKDPVKMIVEAIEEERMRCIDLFVAATGDLAAVPVFMVDPDRDW